MTGIIQIEDISKSFGSVQALKDVSFSIQENEVLALVGDNGAGKSTLIKILSGVLQPTSGTIYLKGEAADLQGYQNAQDHGIETVYQEFALAPNRSVRENIFLGKEPVSSGPIGRLLRMVDDGRMRVEAEAVLDDVGIDLDPDATVGNLSGGEQQSVEVARALQSDPDIIILDEPTSALSVEAARRILDLIKRLQDRGITIIIISHNMDEIFEVSDRIAILATGELMGVEQTEALTREEIIQMMMGVEHGAVNQ